MPKRRVGRERQPPSAPVVPPYHRFLVPLAGVAAALAIAFTGVSLVAADARPGDPLWGLTRVLYPDYAQSIEAAAAVNTDLEAARAALREGKLDEAKDALEKAGIALPKVSADDLHTDLSQKHAALLDQVRTGIPTEVTSPSATGPAGSGTASLVPPSPPGDCGTGGPPPESTEESSAATPLNAVPGEAHAQRRVGDFQAVVDCEQALLQQGKVAYKGKDRMEAGKPEQVTVRVSGDSVDITSTLPGGGDIHVDSVDVGPLVQAELTGPGFEITRAGTSDDGRRELASGKSVEWKWNVRPLDSGELRLDLLIKAWTSSTGAPPMSKQATEATVASFPVTVEPDLWQVVSPYLPLAGFVVLLLLLAWSLVRHKSVRQVCTGASPTNSATIGTNGLTLQADSIDTLVVNQTHGPTPAPKA